MYLKIKPSHFNQFPIGGFLIKGNSVKNWLLEIQNLSFDLSDIEFYPVPGNVANTIWGCFVITNKSLDVQTIGRNQLCQRVNNNLYIPEKSTITPTVTDKDQSLLFSSTLHLCHPEFGTVKLEEKVNLTSFINEPTQKSKYIIEPEPAVFIPKQIKSFHVKPVANEDILKKLEEKAFPKKEKLKDEKLSIKEKIKLFAYKKLFKKTDKKDISSKTERTKLMGNIDSIAKSMFKKKKGWADSMQNDFEDLENRNQKEIDKLLNLLKKNPEEALKYAIPLDNSGASRGTNSGQFKITKRWSSFSLFGSDLFAGGSSSGSIELGDHFNVLNDQYHKTAQVLINKGEFEKASFVYMKLLKDFGMAAYALEQGKMYQEAAEIYYKHADNKIKAAECYEKANMNNEAINLYEEIENYEKVGDLYTKLKKTTQANQYFEKSIDKHKTKNKYILGSLIYQYKIKDLFRAQNLLLEGWDKNIDSYNCMIQYLSNVQGQKVLKTEIENIYHNKLTIDNQEIFLKVVQKEYNKNNDRLEYLREIGYELIANQVKENPSIITELKKFNQSDQELMKDISRFNTNKK